MVNESGQVCPQCGARSPGKFCKDCGTSMGATEDVTEGRTKSGKGKVALVAVLATLALAAAVGAAFWLGGRSKPEVKADTERTTSVVEETTTTTTAVPTTTVPARAAPPPTVGDVRTLEAGLFCRDLNARGFSYSAAVDYWRLHGQTNQMDSDLNGIPCETVYLPDQVRAYWGSAVDRGVEPEYVTIYDLPGGLLCRDLQSRGFGTFEALEYYVLEGFPSRMDADGNGVPCETVYPDAGSVWFAWF